MTKIRATVTMEGKLPREVAQLAAKVLTGVVAQDAAIIASQRIPALYASGIVYRREPPGQEDFANIAVVLAQGWGDCDDLAPWRVAELQAAGVDARVAVRWGDPPSRIYHVIVLVRDTPKNVARWSDLTARQIRGVRLPGPRPRLSPNSGDTSIPGFLIEDPCRVLGMGFGT